MESARFQSATRKAASVANYHHGTLEHDVPVTECDYWISGMRVVKPSRRKPPFPTVASSKTPGMEIRKARPRAIRMALRIFISGDKFPVGGNRITRILSMIIGIVSGYCANLKTLSSFSLNTAISCPILSLVMRA